MKIVHRARKSHNNVDELSRLLIIYVHAHAYLVITIEVSEKFLDKLKKSLKFDSIFKRIYQKLQQQIQNTMNDVNDSITTYQSYRFDIDNDLLYLVNRFSFDRVCISTALKRDVMKFVHDNHAHEDIHRILNHIKASTYFSKMKKKTLVYVESCLVCQLFKSSRKSLYEQLNLIEITIQFLVEFNMNFIVELSMISTEHNSLLTIIDRFSKYVRLIVDREDWSIKQWVEKYHRELYRHWDLFSRIVSNRDFKFTSDFWTTLFIKSEVKLSLITTYHSFSNDQVERTNQIVKTTLRCLLVDKYEKNWEELLSQVEYALNIAKNVFITIISFELLYEIKSRESLVDLISIKLDSIAIDFINQRQTLRNEIYDAIQLAQTRMTIIYDSKHRTSNLHDSIFLKIIKMSEIDYHILDSSSLSIKKIDSFKIKKKISDLIYQLKLFEIMRIHDVIFIVHLEQAHLDFFDRAISSSSIIEHQEERLYVIQKILKREKRDDEFEYKIKWKDYSKATWESVAQLTKDVSNMMTKFEQRRSRWRRALAQYSHLGSSCNSLSICISSN